MSKPATPEQAFTRSGAGYEFAGKKLPFLFTPHRQAAARCMGLRYGFVDEDDITITRIEVDVPQGKGKKPKKQKVEFPTYAQQFSDVVFVMWLCHVPESRVQRAERKPSEARSEAFKWAESQGIGITSQRYFDALATFYRIMEDITVSTGVPVTKNGEDEDDDPND